MSKIIEYHQQGDFSKTRGFLNAIKEMKIYSILEVYGQQGVSVLAAATPKKTGETASSWTYATKVTPTEVSITWSNTKVGSDGSTPIALLIQLGHGTRNGGYVPPNDYINPAMKPLFDEATEAVWRVVTSL